MNWLLTAALERNLQSLQMKINNSNPEALRKAFEETAAFEDFSNSNALHLIARLFDGEGFIELIDKMPADLLNQYILKVNDWQMSGLHCALVFQRRDEGILLLLDRLDPTVLNSALAAQDAVGFTGFMAAAEYQQLPVLEKVFNETTKQTFVKTLSATNQNKSNQLNMVMRRAPFVIMERIIEWLDDPTLEKNIRSEDKDNFHGLHVAALYQSDDTLQLLAKRLSDKVTSDLAMRTTARGMNYLHYLFATANSTTVTHFLDKISQNTLAGALMQLDNERWSAYSIALDKQDNDVVNRLTNLLDDVQLNRVFSVINYEDTNCLFPMMKYQSEELILNVINRLDVSTLSKLLMTQDNSNQTILNICAIRFPSHVLEILLQKADTSIIDHELRTRIKSHQFEGWNLLNIVAHAHNADIFMKVLAKASDNAIEAAVTTTCRDDNSYGISVLHQIFEMKDVDAVEALLNRLSKPTLVKMMLATNKYNWTPMHAAAFSAEETLLLLTEHVDGATLDKVFPIALSHHDVRGTTVLHLLLLNQSFEVIKKVCDKVSQAVLEQTLLMPLMYGDKTGHNALMVMTYHCNNDVLDYFLKRISKKVIAQATLVRASDGCSALHYAARFLRAESVLNLCDCLTDEQFNQIIVSPADMIEVRHVTPIQLMLSGQFPQVSLEILQRMSKASIEKAMITKSSLGFSPLAPILALYDYQTIKYVLDNISDEALKTALQDSHKHYYQNMVGNMSLTSETVNLILNELQARTGM